VKSDQFEQKRLTVFHLSPITDHSSLIARTPLQLTPARRGYISENKNLNGDGVHRNRLRWLSEADNSCQPMR